MCIWLSSKAVQVPVNSLNHEPHTSRTWHSRLESLNKMLVKKWTLAGRERCHEIDCGVCSWEKLNFNQQLTKFPNWEHSFTITSLLFLILHGFSSLTSEMQWSQDVSHIPLQQEETYWGLSKWLLLKPLPVFCQPLAWLHCQSKWYMQFLTNTPRSSSTGCATILAFSLHTNSNIDI